MTWIFKSAIKEAKHINVTLKNNDNKEVKELVYTNSPSYDKKGKKTEPMADQQFKKMIKSEVKVWLKELNKKISVQDISDQISP
jgi:hypothetical protein